MHWINKSLAMALWLSIAPSLHAQHYNAWFRTTLSVPVHEKLRTDTELQLRRQNGFGNENPLGRNLMYGFAQWIHYQHTANAKFSVSPFGYLTHYRIVQTQADEAARPMNEIRFSAAADLQHRIWDSFYAMNRTATEYRRFNNSLPDVVRLRNRLALRYDINDSLKISVFDELHMNLSGPRTDHFFDQNRLGLNLEYKLLPAVKVDFGFIRLNRLPLTTPIVLNENNLFMNLTYSLQQKGKGTS